MSLALKQVHIMIALKHVHIVIALKQVHIVIALKQVHIVIALKQVHIVIALKQVHYKTHSHKYNTGRHEANDVPHAHTVGQRTKQFQFATSVLGSGQGLESGQGVVAPSLTLQKRQNLRKVR
jgi:hypothetical protein